MAETEGICQEDDAGRLVAITILSSVCVLTVFGNTMVRKQDNPTDLFLAPKVGLSISGF